MKDRGIYEHNGSHTVPYYSRLFYAGRLWSGDARNALIASPIMIGFIRLSIVLPVGELEEFDVSISPKALSQLNSYIDYLRYTLLNGQAAYLTVRK